jgi:hypothetical protein
MGEAGPFRSDPEGRDRNTTNVTAHRRTLNAKLSRVVYRNMRH